MARKSAGDPKPSRGFRMSQEALDKVERVSKALRITQGEYLEALVMESRLEHTAYFAQQAAVEAMVASMLAATIASKVLTPSEATAVRDYAAQLAEELFGSPLERPEEVGVRTGDGDPRVRALFQAFGAG